MAGYRFPPEIISCEPIWLTSGLHPQAARRRGPARERGISCVLMRPFGGWVNHFGPMIAADLQVAAPKPHTTWHLDEVYLKIDGRMVYSGAPTTLKVRSSMCWSQSKRKQACALKLMRNLLKKYAISRANDHRRSQIIRCRGPRPGYRRPP